MSGIIISIKKIMKNPHKALEAIEILVGDDFGLEMECLLNKTKKEKKTIDPRLLKAAEIIGKIYCIAHSETSHQCRHEDWENIKYDIIKNQKI